MGGDINAAQVIFEFVRYGNAIKVTAFHVPTLTEVSFVGPRGAGEAHLKLIGLRKLQYVLNKNQQGRG